MNEFTNVREHKGESLLAATGNYTAIDFETTGLDPSCDSIIEVGAVRVRNGEIAERFQSFVNPGFEIDEFITELTGITNDMLSEAPGAETVLPKIFAFIGSDTVIAHNANFDINFMYDSCLSLNLPPFSNNFIDTMRMSRRLFPEQQHHRLKDLVERFKIVTPAEHRALEDAETAHLCYEYMAGYCLSNNIDLGLLAKKDRHKLKASDVSTTNTQFDESSPVFGKVFVFTGTLEKMIRKEAMQMVVDMGGLCGDTVTKKTNFLVLGNNDYCSTIKGGKSSKQKKAEQLRLADCDIEILSENVFYEMISLE